MFSFHHHPTLVFSEALWPKISNFNSHERCVTWFFFITWTPRVCPLCPSWWQCESTRVENRRLNRRTNATHGKYTSRFRIFRATNFKLFVVNEREKGPFRWSRLRRLADFVEIASVTTCRLWQSRAYDLCEQINSSEQLVDWSTLYPMLHMLDREICGHHNSAPGRATLASAYHISTHRRSFWRPTAVFGMLARWHSFGRFGHDFLAEKANWFGCNFNANTHGMWTGEYGVELW